MAPKKKESPPDQHSTDTTLNNGLPEWQGLDDEGKEQLARRQSRSGKGRARGGFRTLQNLADGAVTSAESQELAEQAKVEDHEAAVAVAEGDDQIEVVSVAKAQ